MGDLQRLLPAADGLPVAAAPPRPDHAARPPATQPPASQPPATQPPATQPPATQPSDPATQPLGPATQPSAPVPATPAVVTAWIRSLSGVTPRTLAVRLAADPALGRLLPAVFELPGMGALLDEAWPPALLRLAATGRVERARLLQWVLHRLREGDRPRALRPILEIHRLLGAAPAADPADYLALLTCPPPVAAAAQEALRSLDDAGRLDVAVLAAAGSSVLPRPEPKLVRAQLAWLDAALARRPGDAAPLLAAVATGLANPRIDLAERALRLLAARPGGPAVLRAHLDGIDGDLRRQASEALGLPAAPRAPSFAPAPGPYAPEPMPPPVAAADLAAAMRSPLSPAALERVLTGLVTAAADGDALAGLLPLLPGLAPADGPLGLLGARVRELAAQFAAGRPPPVLLAAPALADGHVDPARLLFRLVEADADGWQPGPLDLAQALLRLPRRVGDGVTRAAARLQSPAGRRFAAWLRDGGLPDPPVTVVVVPSAAPPSAGRSRGRPPHPDGPEPAGRPHPAAAAPAGATRGGGRARRLVALPRLDLPSGPLPPPALPEPDAGPPAFEGWPMALPGHREIVAAHVLPFLVPGTGRGHHAAGAVLPALARSGGPFGPATALCLAYGLGARNEADRQPAVAALSHLASTGGLDAPLTGRELGQLVTDGTVVLGRVVPALAEVQRGGAAHVVWAIARTLVPVLLRQDRPPPATADLLSLATAAAAATGCRADLPEVTALAGRPGRSRLAAEAARLARTVDG